MIRRFVLLSLSKCTNHRHSSIVIALQATSLYSRGVPCKIPWASYTYKTRRLDYIHWVY